MLIKRKQSQNHSSANIITKLLLLLICKPMTPLTILYMLHVQTSTLSATDAHKYLFLR